PPSGAAGEDAEGDGRDERRAPGAGAHALASRSRALPVSARQLLEDVAERDATLPEQHQRVEPEIGDLRDDPGVTLAAERRRHDLDRLLADLAAHRGLALREQACHVRAGRRRRLALLHDAISTPPVSASCTTAGIRPRASYVSSSGVTAAPGRRARRDSAWSRRWCGCRSGRATPPAPRPPGHRPAPRGSARAFPRRRR